MFTKRSIGTNRRRLCVEVLEGREVPAGDVLTGIVEEPLLETPPSDVVVTTETPPTDPLPSTEPPLEVTTELPAEGEVVALEDVPAGPAADLATQVIVDKLRPSIGDVITFRVTVTNNGDESASGVVLATALPAGVTLITAAAGQGEYDAATGTWDVGVVNPATPLTLALKVRVIDAAEQSTTAAITASDLPDPDASNNEASKTVTPVLATIKLTNIASAARLAVGSAVVFTITVRNAGPGTARNIAIKDVLGPGLTFVRAQAPTRGSFNTATRTWSITTLPAGAAGSLRIVAQVKSTGKLQGTALLSGTGLDAENSKFEAVGSVTGTKASTPATWSYTAPNFMPGLVPAPVTAKPANATPLSAAKPIIPLALLKPNL